MDIFVVFPLSFGRVSTSLYKDLLISISRLSLLYSFTVDGVHLRTRWLTEVMLCAVVHLCPYPQIGDRRVNKICGIFEQPITVIITLF